MSRPRGALRLGQVRGIELYVHFTLPIVGLLLLIPALYLGFAPSLLLRGTMLFLALFTFVALHELGHALMAARMGIRTRHITLLPFGGLAQLERLPTGTRAEMLVALAGPAVNLALAAALLPVYLWLEPAADALAQLPDSRLLSGQLLWMNVLLGVFNLTPAFPMDGGRVLRALLGLVLAPLTATRIAARIGQAMAIALVGLVILYRLPTLLPIAIFVFVAAGSELRGHFLRTLIQTGTVAQAMTTTPHCLPSDLPIGEAWQYLMRTGQLHFPVLRTEGRPPALLTREALVSALRVGDTHSSIATLVREAPLLTPSMPLEDALRELQATQWPLLAVVSQDRIVGVLTLEGIRQFAVATQFLGSERLADLLNHSHGEPTPPTTPSMPMEEPHAPPGQAPHPSEAMSVAAPAVRPGSDLRLSDDRPPFSLHPSPTTEHS